MAKIMLLRRDESSLGKDEIEAFKAAFPGQDLTFVRLDPRDYVEHAHNCRRERPDAILLPLERPIPALAMTEGFRHVAIREGGVVFELQSLTPEFRPFEA